MCYYTYDSHPDIAMNAGKNNNLYLSAISLAPGSSLCPGLCPVQAGSNSQAVERRQGSSEHGAVRRCDNTEGDTSQ